MKPQLIDINLTGVRSIQIKKVDQYFLNAPFHFHQLCELVCVEKSFGKRVVGDSIQNFEDGDLVLMGPNLPHIWQNDALFHKENNQYRVKATVIYFPPDFLLKLTDEEQVLMPTLDLIKRSARGLRFKNGTSENVSKILAEISEVDGLTKIIQFLQAIEILSQSRDYEYLASISFEHHYDEKDTSRINKVYQFLMKNFHRDIHLKEVAALCFMSPEAFCRFFKSRTQKTFTQFLNELRIGHACKLLQKGENSISDVCYESGYNNIQNFNKFFKLITGKTPTEYKKKL